MHPPVAHLQTLLTASGIGLHVPDLIEMRTCRHLGHSLHRQTAIEEVSFLVCGEGRATPDETLSYLYLTSTPRGSAVFRKRSRILPLSMSYWFLSRVLPAIRICAGVRLLAIRTTASVAAIPFVRNFRTLSANSS